MLRKENGDKGRGGGGGGEEEQDQEVKADRIEHVNFETNLP